MSSPRPTPLTNDLRPLRLALGLTQVAAATAWGVWLAVVSRIERGTSWDRDTARRYREWLETQSEKTD